MGGRSKCKIGQIHKNSEKKTSSTEGEQTWPTEKVLFIEDQESSFIEDLNMLDDVVSL